MQREQGDGRPVSFAERVAFHLRNAINSDLNELLMDSPGIPVSNPSPRIRFDSDSEGLSVSDVANKTPQDGTLPAEFLAEERKICQVQFRFICRHFAMPSFITDIPIGEFVIVQSFVDRSLEDLGVVVNVFSAEEHASLTEALWPFEDADEYKVGKLLRIATEAERRLLPVKLLQEEAPLRLAQAYVRRALLPIEICGVEYQYDGSVLFVYYVSEERVDYRALVKFLFKHYNKTCRVQMKKMNVRHSYVLRPFAAAALRSGQYVLP